MNALFFVWLLVMGDPATVTKPPANPFSEHIFSRLGAPRDECLPGALRKLGKGVEADCAFPDIKTKNFLETWQSSFPEDLTSDSVTPLGSWIRTLGGGLRRYFEVDGIPTLVAYGGRQPGLIVAYFTRYPHCLGGGGSIPRAGRNGVSRPQRIREAWVEPGYPAKARRARVDGMVLLRAVIDKEGNTKDLCVLDVQPRRYGFEDAAMEAVKTNRYEPALKDGEPVEAQLAVVKTFEIQ